jgi:hypothetical protein
LAEQAESLRAIMGAFGTPWPEDAEMREAALTLEARGRIVREVRGMDIGAVHAKMIALMREAQSDLPATAYETLMRSEP